APRVLRRLAAAVGGAAWLLDAGAAVRCASPPGAEPPPGAAAAVARMRARGSHTASADTSGERALLVLPVGVQGRPQEFLVLAAATLPRAVRSTAATAVALLGLVADRERAERQRDRRLLGCAVDLLCTGAAGAAGQVLLADGGGAAVPDRLRVLRAAAVGEQHLP
ncbi:hypothetical protein GTR02_22070, partial [Kineococcus sp. R8]